jgi:hypothetical protein
MFATATDYHELNAGAHRNPPRILTAPLLVRHLTFWTNPDPLDPSDTTKTPEQIKAAVDNYILELCRGLDPEKASDPSKASNKAKTAGTTEPPPTETGPAQPREAIVSDLELHPNILGIRLLFDTKCDAKFYEATDKSLNPRQEDIFSSTSRAVWVQFDWKRLDVTIRFEIHTEYFSMSIFVELDKDPKKTLAAGSYSDLDDLNHHIGVALEFFDERRTLEKRKKRRDKATRKRDGEKAGDINDYFFHTFWETFSEKVLGAASAEATEARFFQRIFGDFRGLILSEQAVEFDDYGKQAVEFDVYGKEVERPRKFTWGEDAKASFLPLIQHRERESRYECTVNYLLDGRAFYMSTLGPQTPSVPQEQRIPVEFILYASQRFPKRPLGPVDPAAPDDSKTIVNQWQLGRLVSQLLLLGTLRLCALKDVKLLREASQALSTLDERTEKAREAIAGKEEAERKKREENRRKRLAIAGKNAGNGASESEAAGASGAAESGTEAAAGTNSSDNDNDADVMDRIAQAHKELNGINGIFLKKTGKGLLYRVERSRYYVQQFDDNVKLLRIRRVEGDQPYDQLIKRRLGSEFDFINRLGIRYERARGTIVTLDQNYLAINQNSLVERANQIDEDIHAIQMWGEVVLFLALVPYYLTHLLVLILGEQDAELMAVNVWLGCVLVFLGKTYRVWKLVPEWMVGKPKGALNVKVRRTVVIIAAIAIALTIEFLVATYRHEKPLHGLKIAIEKGNCYLAQGLKMLQKQASDSAPVDCDNLHPKTEHAIPPGASNRRSEPPKPASTNQPDPATTDSSTPSPGSVPPDTPKSQPDTPPAAEPPP